MCGIVGVAGESSKANDQILSTLLILDAVRGIDSTGIAHIHRTGEVSLAKAIGNPFELLGSRQFEKVTMPPARAIIGHNRFATQGAVNKANAHPFEFENIVGVHNGTLMNKGELLDNKLFTVDSENLYHHMNEKGLYDLLGVMRGAWSLVWWDKLENELCFLRNKERPMWMCWSEDYKSLYWASEKWMLEVALGKANVKHFVPEQTEVDKLYTFPIDNKGVVYKPTVIERPSRAIFLVGGAMVNQQNASAKATSLQLIKETSPSNVPKSDRTSMVLEILTSACDVFGAHYYVCFSPRFPEWNLRLYYNKTMEELEPCTEIVADVSDVSYTELIKGSTGKCEYYKVVASSVAVVGGFVPHDANASDVDFTEQGVHYTTFKGKKVPRSEWDSLHGTCDYCTGYVDPDSDFRYTTEGNTLCSTCASDKSVTNLIKLV